MSLVSTTCPTCGVIDVPIARVVLRVRDRVDGGTCVMRCPHCAGRVSREADVAMSVLLIAVGVEVSYWPVCLEQAEPPGPITHGELVEFHRVLADDNRVEMSFGTL